MSTELIDKVLFEDDLDGDGYLSYIEYVLGRQKDDHELRQTTTAGLWASVHIEFGLKSPWKARVQILQSNRLKISAKIGSYI